MKILFLTYKFPHAEVVGGHRIVYQRIRYLKQAGHQVGLVSFVRGETKEQMESMRPLLSDMHILPHPHRNLAVRAFHDYLALSRPAVFWKLYSSAMTKTVGDVVEQGGYDVVISEFSEMGQYLYKNPYLPAVRRIMSCHRCVTASYEKYQDIGEVRLRLHYKSLPQMRWLRQYEFNMYRSADRILVMTPQDRFTMQYYAQDLAVSIAPSGVDIRYLQDYSPIEKKPIVLMTGYMQDPANEDGVKWFMHHVWPELSLRQPKVKFYIVGAEPGPRIMRLVKGDPRVIVTGEVEDLRPYRNRAMVFVSPVRLGSGMRLKVLEAMAGGLPVVSTSLGMAGIDAQTGVNCLVADTPELFSRSVEWLLTDRSLNERMAQSARELVEKKYTLEDGLSRFEKIVKSVVEG
jgi:glycosyltransferase involved in cell wall biosynthesis